MNPDSKQEERWRAVAGGIQFNDWWVVTKAGSIPQREDASEWIRPAFTLRYHYQADELRDYLNRLEDRAALADVAEAFAQQLALKQRNDGTYRLVWSGDYDDIYNDKLRQLVTNYLHARYAALQSLEEKSRAQSLE